MNLGWAPYIFGLFFQLVVGREVYERIGYFWHITDIHYDAHFNFNGDARKGCWRPDYEGGLGTRAQRRPTGTFGDYGCDATWELIESAARTMMSRQNDNVDFVLWTGDALSHFATRRLPETHQLALIQNLTDLLGKTFSSQFVFPALGHDDPISRRELGRIWSRWLPTDSMKTFETGGYYIIERKQNKLQIVVLNTNLMKRADEDKEAAKQWEWLEKVLQKFQKNGETVYLVGHMPPGSDERQKGGIPPAHAHVQASYTAYHNKEYIRLVRRYSSIIMGQFFGHLHSDTFRVIYGTNNEPVSWAMMAPSLTPKRTHDGPNNPGLRLYKFDKDTGQVFDYTQYYLDLSSANYEQQSARADASGVANRTRFLVEYNFSTLYNFNEINAANLHALADKFVQYSNENDNSYFNKYYRANSVKISSRTQSNCDDTCAHTHYCAITRVDFDEFQQCLKAAAGALSSQSPGLFCGKFLILVCLIFGFVK